MKLDSRLALPAENETRFSKAKSNGSISYGKTKRAPYSGPELVEERHQRETTRNMSPANSRQEECDYREGQLDAFVSLDKHDSVREEAEKSPEQISSDVDCRTLLIHDERTAKQSDQVSEMKMALDSWFYTMIKMSSATACDAVLGDVADGSEQVMNFLVHDTTKVSETLLQTTNDALAQSAVAPSCADEEPIKRRAPMKSRSRTPPRRAPASQRRRRPKPSVWKLIDETLEKNRLEHRSRRAHEALAQRGNVPRSVSATRRGHASPGRRRNRSQRRSKEESTGSKRNDDSVGNLETSNVHEHLKKSCSSSLHSAVTTDPSLGASTRKSSGNPLRRMKQSLRFWKRKDEEEDLWLI